MKKSILALAVSLAAVSSANAAWETGAGLGDGFSGNGEMILTVWDPVKQISYSQDLGVRFDDLRSGAALNQTIALNASALAIFGGDHSNLLWNVAASSNHYLSMNGGDLQAQFDKYGFMVSADPSNTQAPGATGEQQFGNISATIQQFSNYGATLGMFSGPVSQNGTAIESSANGPRYAGGALWGNVFSQQYNLDANGSLGESLDLLMWGFAGPGEDANPLLVNLGKVSFGLNGLTFATSEVPLPAAFWLMASGLAGLGAVARSRKQA